MAPFLLSVEYFSPRRKAAEKFFPRIARMGADNCDYSILNKIVTICLDHGEDVVPSARTLGKRSAGFFATKDHIERKERLFSGFFLSAEALAKADVILRG
jgi:hypothetical protein